MVWAFQTRACARFVCRGVFAALLALCAANCSETTSSNAALSTGAASGPTVAFDSIDGPPVTVFNRLVDNLSGEARARQVPIASRDGAANYRVRGYLAAQVIRGRTHISWVFDIYDDGKVRALRIVGEEPAGRAGGDPWSVADESMLRRIAAASMDRLAAFLRNPDAPVGAGAAIAAIDQAAPLQANARTPSAAEKLALAAGR